MDLIYVKGKSDKNELLLTVLVPVLLGILSYFLVKNHIAEYAVLQSISPKAFEIILPGIWFFTLICSGVASYRAKLAQPGSVSHTYYAAQLLLAFLWSLAIIRFERPNEAFVLIIMYLFFLAATFFEFDKADKKSGLLMLPSIVWAVVLAFINFYICKSIII